MTPIYTTSTFFLPLKKGCAAFAIILLFHLHSTADVALSTVTVGAGNVLQGTTNHLVYILQLDVSGASAQMTNFSMVSSGNYAGTDVDRFRLWRNTSPSLTGASSLAFFNTPAGNGETVSFATNTTFAVGTHYLLLSADIFSNAMDENSVHFDGAAHPAVLTFTGAPAQTNSQVNNAGLQTIQAPDVTYSAEAVAAADILQNTTNNVAYILRLDVANFDVDMNTFSITSSGTYASGDLSVFRIWRNTSPSLSGAISVGFDNSSTGSGEVVGFNISSSGSNDDFLIGTHYLIVTVDVAPAGVDGHTLRFDGSASPVSIGFTTSPNITNNQADNAGVQTIQAPDVTYSTEAVAAADILQNTTFNVAYILRLDVASFDVDMNTFFITSSGTYASGDFTVFRIWRNTTPSLSGATFLGTDNSSTGSGEVVSFNISSSGSNDDFLIGTHYLIVSVDVAPAGLDGHTLRFDGSASPVSIAFTTSPNVTNNQADNAGVQTIQAPDVTYSTEAVAAADILQNSTNNVAYIMRLDVASFDVDMNTFFITSSGTYASGDFSVFRIWRNTSPNLSGATLLGTDNSSTGSGEAVSFSISSSGNNDDFLIGTHYLIVTVDVAPAGLDGHTLRFDGSASPVSIAFTTSPNVTNNQADNAGVQTIQAPDVTYSTEAVAAADILQNTTFNVAYILRLDVASFDVDMNTFTITSSGTYASGDFSRFQIWRNTSPSLSGAIFIGIDNSSTGSGEVVSLPISSSGSNDDFLIGTHYLIVTVDVAPAAVDGNTLHFDGSASPVSISYTTSPNVTNNQSNNAGVQTIQAADVTYSTEVVAAAHILEGSTDNISYVLRMDVSTVDIFMTNLSISTEGSYDNDDLDRCRLWRNTSPNLTGATNLASDVSLTGAPETVVFNISNATFATGTHYLLITTDVDAAADQGHTLHFNGASNPAVLTFTTAPNVTDGQANNAGIQTVGAPLPVELTAFWAEPQNENVLLQWTTASELGNDHFVVEHSPDGRLFAPVGKMAGAGDSFEERAYSFFHEGLQPGQHYYRLQQVDFDGRHEFSKTVAVSLEGIGLRVFPNPVTGLLNIAHWGDGVVRYDLQNSSGQVLKSGILTQGTVDLTTIHAGVYFLLLKTGRQVLTEKIIKQ